MCVPDGAYCEKKTVPLRWRYPVRGLDYYTVVGIEVNRCRAAIASRDRCSERYTGASTDSYLDTSLFLRRAVVSRYDGTDVTGCLVVLDCVRVLCASDS